MSISIFAKRLLSVLFIYILCNSFFLHSILAQNTVADLDADFSIEICDEKSSDINKLENSCFKKISLFKLNSQRYKDRICLKITVIDSNKKFIDFDKNIDSIKVYANNELFLTGSLVSRSKKQLQLSVDISAIEIPVYNQPFYIELISSQQIPISANLEVLTADKFNQIYVEKRQNAVQFQIFFQGMMWIILFYNLFLFFTSREKVYLAYTIYIFGFSCFSLQNSGLLVDYFAAENPYYSLLFRMGALATIAIGFSAFILTFLPQNTINSFWKRFFYILMVFSFAMLIPYIIINYGFENSFLYSLISKVVHGIVMLFILVFIGYLARKSWSDMLVKYFLAGSFIVVAAASLSNILKAAFGDSLGDVYLIPQIGIILEILLFSLGLGYRMRNLEKENAKILENQNKLLEHRVLERTKEISLKQEEILVQNEELQQQQEEIISQRDYIGKQNTQLKTANTQFTDSVRYAKTIQKAILPMKQRVQTHFEDSFVLFRPRDIVSGDFYWIYETEDLVTKEEIILVAVLDCTGHGVPGAFISLIGYAILNEIVSKRIDYKTCSIITTIR